MNFSFSPLQKAIRSLSLLLIPYFFILILFVLLGAQFRELGSSNEILSLTSFIILISFSALAFNWSRVSTSFTDEATLKTIYESGVDLFLASLTALISTFFAWLQTASIPLPKFSYSIVFMLHWVFILLSLGLFFLSVLQLLGCTRKILKETK